MEWSRCSSNENLLITKGVGNGPLYSLKMKKLLLLLLLPLTVLSQPTYPQTNYLGEYGNHYYYMSTNTFSFWDAVDDLKSKDSSLTLISIHSQEEMDFIDSTMNYGPGMHYTWIGGIDTAEEGVFTWLDGTPWDYENFPDNEPNNGVGTGGYPENYVMINYYSGESWNDATNLTDNFFYLFKVSKGGQTNPIDFTEISDTVEVSQVVTTSQDTTNISDTTETDEDYSQYDMKIFPNPYRSEYEHFYFRSPWRGEALIAIKDRSGKVVHHQIHNITERDHRIDVGYLPAGSYLGIVKMVNQKLKYRFVVLVVN